MSSSVIEKVNGHAVAAEPRFDPVALAEADAIRTRADAEADALRVEAEGKAKASEIKAVEEARKLKLANDKAAARAAEEQAARDARIAESNRKREEADRAKLKARQDEEKEQRAAAGVAEEVAVADDKWRSYALWFYRVCAVVAMPVQIAAFYNPRALWLMVAPVMLEGGAWVVQKGAASAVANGRPSWHYRLIAWLLAFIAAGINLWHGLNAFDPATALGTAFASLAGPGVWDLHEHGRIRKRDGVPTRREQKLAKKVAKGQTAEKAAAEKAEAERQAHRENAARDAAAALDAARAAEFPEVHKHAKRLAADLGERTITESIWKRAKLDVDGALPGESAEVLRMRNAAERRVTAARENTSVTAVSKTTNAQRASQMPATRKPRVYNPPARAGRRSKGDTPKYVAAARKQAAITARNASAENN
ncbi:MULTISPECIES: hypothetical protein [unclassified Streptomyces]|uniref:hypothetical protein n=1 Tax=unclassified Streptomyces TaxID=2593676 RepID=UPI00224D0EF1|nr:MULTISPECIES: hypothetical protein [unclassified Streptomyces]MCX4863474.1 hypothetical protein [Streptomyces sp. NBC_00906]MCX4894712.1 hypothetical protein [Streptomyces sp. NBC_00892]